jgi:hypothetical protein
MEEILPACPLSPLQRNQSIYALLFNFEGDSHFCGWSSDLIGCVGGIPTTSITPSSTNDSRLVGATSTSEVVPQFSFRFRFFEGT